MSSDKSKKGLRLLQFYKKNDRSCVRLTESWKGDDMPYSLKSCLAFIYHHNIDAKHVLRKNGNKVAHDVLCSYLKKNTDLPPTFYINSVYDVCSAVKAYVKDIPEGLLVKELEHDWHKLVKLNNEVKVREKLLSLIQKLPLANKSMLFHLLFLASAVTKRRFNNEMSTKSLSIVLMPSMFEKVVDIAKARDLNGFYDLLEFMIDNASLIIGKELYKKIENNLTEIGNQIEVIQQVVDEPSKIDEDKLVQFASQDSGLNSTSFIEDKGSQSLSSIGRTNNTDQNISSMEDLLDTSDSTSDISDLPRQTNIFRSTTIVGQKNILGSKDSAYCILERCKSQNSSSLSLPSQEDHHEICVKSPDRRTKPRIHDNHNCIGLNIHSIKECRPYSICGSPSHKKDINTIPCDINASSTNIYISVYDRSLQKLEKVNDCHTSSWGKTEFTCHVNLKSSNIQRKKAVLKRSSCIIGPLERIGNFLDSTNLKLSTSMTTKNSPPNDIDNNSTLSSTIPTLSRIKKSQVPLKQKLRIKRKSFLFRGRFSAPIKMDHVEAPVLLSQQVVRAVSFQQSQTSLKPLPKLLEKYLRQRSSQETFV